MTPGQSETGQDDLQPSVVKPPVRVRIRIKTILITIAIVTPFVYLVIVPLWRFYSRPWPDRQILWALEQAVESPSAAPQPLVDVLKQLKRSTQTAAWTGIPIYVDPVGLQASQSTMKSVVRLPGQRMKLRATLEEALRQRGLWYRVKNGLLVISTPERLAASPDKPPSP